MNSTYRVTLYFYNLPLTSRYEKYTKSERRLTERSRILTLSQLMLPSAGIL